MMRDRSKHVHDGRLEVVFVQDLTLPGVFDDAVKGVDAIVHTASVSVCNTMLCTT